MARKDVILRYAQVENDYIEMCQLLKDLDADLKADRIDREYYDSRVEILSEEIETIKTQYFFWAEVIFELNKPRRKGKEMNDCEKAWYNTIKTCTKEAIKDDTKDALKYIKNLIEEGRLK